MCTMCKQLHTLCKDTCAQGTTSCTQMKENRDKEREGDGSTEKQKSRDICPWGGHS